MTVKTQKGVGGGGQNENNLLVAWGVLCQVQPEPSLWALFR